MKFTLAPLPYSNNALAPYISSETLELHHGKHHKRYMEKLKKAVDGSPDAGKSLDELVMTLEGDAFNNAAQVWNHDFLWHSMSPEGGATPAGELGQALRRDIGGIDDFKKSFIRCATTHFGSGWTWLAVGADGRLRIFSTSNADTPIRSFQVPLLVLDMWEHAYYVDYRNDKQAYVQAFVDQLVNWEFARSNYERWARALRNAA